MIPELLRGGPRRTGTFVVEEGHPPADQQAGHYRERTLLTYITENPWPIGLVSAVFLLIFSILFLREGELRMLIAGLVALACLGGVFLLDWLVVTPAEHGERVVRSMVRAAEEGDPDAVLEHVSPKASLHLGDIKRPGRSYEVLEDSLRTLERGNRITDNMVTRLDGVTMGDDRSNVGLACITTTSSSMGSVPTTWLFEVTRQGDGTWQVSRVVFRSIMGKPPRNPI